MHILVAIDLQHDVERIVDGAIAWASRLGATLDLAYAESYPKVSSWNADAAELMRIEILRRQSEQDEALERLIQRVPKPQRGVAWRIDGQAVADIPDRAAGYDLVIVGTHGRRGLGHLVLGSVAERIARLSPKPVLVLRGVPPEGPMEAVCAVDVRDQCADAVVRVITPWLTALSATPLWTFAEPIGVPPLPDAQLFASAWLEFEDAQAAGDAARLDALRLALPETLRGRTFTGRGPAALVLGDACAGHPLVVLVTHGRTGVSRWWMGSVAEEVVQMAPCSALVLRRPA